APRTRSKIPPGGGGFKRPPCGASSSNPSRPLPTRSCARARAAARLAPALTEPHLILAQLVEGAHQPRNLAVLVLDRLHVLERHLLAAHLAQQPVHLEGELVELAAVEPLVGALGDEDEAVGDLLRHRPGAAAHEVAHDGAIITSVADSEESRPHRGGRGSRLGVAGAASEQSG